MFTWDSKKHLKEMNKTGHSLVAISLTACIWFLSKPVRSSQANLIESAKVTSSCLAHTTHCDLKIYFKNYLERHKAHAINSLWIYAHRESHVCVETKLQWLTMNRVLFYYQVISFKFQFSPRQTGELKSSVKEMQGKKFNLRTRQTGTYKVSQILFFRSH